VCRTVRGRRTCRNVTKTRGLLETIGCTSNQHIVQVQYRDASGAINNAQKSARCTR
jgi:hypothetical protein